MDKTGAIKRVTTFYTVSKTNLTTLSEPTCMGEIQLCMYLIEIPLLQTHCLGEALC